MERVGPEPLAVADVARQQMPSPSDPVPAQPRHLQNISTKQLQHPSPLSSSPSSLLLLSTSTTDPSLFSFDIVRKLNRDQLATIPLKPYSAISVVQHRQHQRSQQNTIIPNSTASCAPVRKQQTQQTSITAPETSSSHTPISQFRRASVPDIVSPHPPQPAPSDEREREGLQSRPLRPNPSPASHNTTATLGYGTSEVFGGFDNGKYGFFTNNINNNDRPFPSSSNRTRRAAVVARELYLHPSQFFTLVDDSNNDISGNFSSSLRVDNILNGTITSGLGSTICLPPMFTLEELMQPHILRKPEHGNTSLPTSAAFGPSPSNINGNVIGFYNCNTSFFDITPGTSTFASHPKFSNEIYHSWYGPSSQGDSRGNTYPSYPPPSHRGSPSVQIQVAIADRVLHHLQHAQNMMAFSERVAMPPMREPASGTLSPSSPSPDFNRRDLSPSRPSSRDGQLSQISDTSHDAQPQKRTRKLAATVTATLKNWLLDHTQHPYPTEEEKRALCSATSLTMRQVSSWFINARRRILPALGNVATSGNRKRLTRYKPFEPRRLIPQDYSQGHPPFHADSEGMYSMNGSGMASARMRSHPYTLYGVPHLNLMNGSIAPYKYNTEPGSY